MDNLIGQTLRDRYQIQTLLGRQVGRRTFLSTDLGTQSPVVIKLLLFGPDFAWEDLKLFEREAETLKALDHPAIPTYLDSFDVTTELGQGFALVQSYIEATPLDAAVQQGRRFSEADLVEIAEQLLTILVYLHGQAPPVIHRDIKPSNILLGDRSGHSPGQVYLVDFGSVQTVAHGGTTTIVGTYGYMPPEQFGGRTTPASDIYSLGATLIYLITRVHPADLPQRKGVIQFDATSQVSRPFHAWLESMVQPGLEERISTAEQAVEILKNKNFVSQKSAYSSAEEELQYELIQKTQLKHIQRPEGANCTISKNKRANTIEISAPARNRISVVLSIKGLLLFSMIFFASPILMFAFMFALGFFEMWGLPLALLVLFVSLWLLLSLLLRLLLPVISLVKGFLWPTLQRSFGHSRQRFLGHALQRFARSAARWFIEPALRGFLWPMTWIESRLRSLNDRLDQYLVNRFCSDKILLIVGQDEASIVREGKSKKYLRKVPRSSIQGVQIVARYRFDTGYHVDLKVKGHLTNLVVGNVQFWLSRQEAFWLAYELSTWLKLPVTEVEVVVIQSS
ncbi:serine/threonine protein kinase [filamentous cyanobacterium CCT1]|nr:serine/threonine protein kinase [filamentous cyanobacterium CCT1]PSN76283.1 serine/threonine protein kinase [filamentous cyanobacterium CCP4]